MLVNSKVEKINNNTSYLLQQSYQYTYISIDHRKITKSTCKIYQNNERL
jgi:hypothetical protein